MGEFLPSAHKRWPVWGALLLLCALPKPAYALQPLNTFVQAARVHNPKLLEANAVAEQQQSNADLAIGRVLPGITLRGAYTRNQFQVALPLSTISKDPNATGALVLSPYNQYVGTGTLNVPLVDLAAFGRLAAAKSTAKSAMQQRDATALQVEALVTQTYYQLLANLALEKSSGHALEVAQKNLQLTQARFSVGSAAVLDVDRAKADVELQSQQVSEVQLQVALAARSLRSLTSIEPEVAAEESAAGLADDLHDEEPLSKFSNSDAELPSVHAAVLSTEAASRQAHAQRLALVPALSGQFVETIGNVPNFAGKETYYIGVLALTWNFDYTTVANIQLADAQEVAARAREEQARLDANDALYHYWKTVETYIVRSRSAREQARVSAEAAELAQDRYAAGTATQLDLLQAQRDAFAADVSRIQADADLVNSRAQLRFAAGIHYGN